MEKTTSKQELFQLNEQEQTMKIFENKDDEDGEIKGGQVCTL